MFSIHLIILHKFLVGVILEKIMLVFHADIKQVLKKVLTLIIMICWKKNLFLYHIYNYLTVKNFCTIITYVR